MTAQSNIQNQNLSGSKTYNAKGKAKINVPVKEYRNKINSAFDSINVHWCACRGDEEKVSWFVGAILRFSKLESIDCQRAKPEDKGYYKQVFRLFDQHCEKYFNFWLEARAQLEMSYTEEIK